MAAVLVHIDLDGGQPAASSLVALAAGRRIASSWGAALYAGLIVHEPGVRKPAGLVEGGSVSGLESTERRLARAGADKIVVGLVDAPVAPLWASAGGAWQAVVDHLRPRLVLFGAESRSAAELAPRTAARTGARLLVRARAIDADAVELRDRDGGYVRVGDSGAAVAMIGRAHGAATGGAIERGDHDVELIVISAPGTGDTRIELVEHAPAGVAHSCGALVVIGDDVAGDAKVVAAARRLADLLDAHLVGGAAPIERTTPLAPELCIAIGSPELDLAGATSVIAIGGAIETADGVLGSIRGLADLVARLEGE